MAEIGNPYSYKWTMYPGLYPLSFGDMDYAPDPAIVDAVRQRLSRPLTYPPPYKSSGVVSVIAEYYERTHGLCLPHDAFWLASSCLSLNYHVVSSLVSLGDEVLYWNPAFFHIPAAIEAAGATPVRMETRQHEKITREGIESLITEKTRVIYLVNPHNPTGKVFSADEMTILSELAAEYGLIVVSNELHSRLVLDGEHVPFAAVSDVAAQMSITLSGASKSHNLAGISGAFAFSGNTELLDAVRAPARHKCPDATSLQQAALAAAYREDSPWLSSTVQRLRNARDLACKTLQEGLPALELQPPRATYFLWIDFLPYLRQGETSAEALESRCGVVAGQGAAFGGLESQSRLSFSLDEEVMEKALHQIVEGLPALAGTISNRPE